MFINPLQRFQPTPRSGESKTNGSAKKRVQQPEDISVSEPLPLGRINPHERGCRIPSEIFVG